MIESTPMKEITHVTTITSTCVASIGHSSVGSTLYLLHSQYLVPNVHNCLLHWQFFLCIFCRSAFFRVSKRCYFGFIYHPTLRCAGLT